jgi:hypothetical protein
MVDLPEFELDAGLVHGEAVDVGVLVVAPAMAGDDDDDGALLIRVGGGGQEKRRNTTQGDQGCQERKSETTNPHQTK